MSDPILLWNHVALDANRIDHTGSLRARNQRGPTLSARALAMVHIAMHDAYFGFVPAGAPFNPQGLEPVYAENRVSAPAAPDNDDLVVVISTAAHGVLIELFPSQKDQFDRLLAGVMAGAAGKTSAKDFGEKVAASVVTRRKHDKSNITAEPVYKLGSGHHGPDPLSEPKGILGEKFGDTDRFALSANRVEMAPPPGWTTDMPFDEKDPIYLHHYQEVKEKGRSASTTRTIEETVTGIYWAYDGVEEIGAPPRLYNQIAVQIMNQRYHHANSCARLIVNARLLMLINVAMADAAIEAWHYKFKFDLWRPVNGIRERGDRLGTDKKSPASTSIDPDADPFWEPLGAPNSNTVKKDFTPPFPAYPSGHATFGAAMFEMLRLYFEIKPDQPDNCAFDFISDEMNGLSKDSRGNVRPRHCRHHASLLDAMYDNALSRVYLGVHWRFDGTTAKSASEILDDKTGMGGIPLGRKVAAEVLKNLNKDAKVPSAPM